MGKPLAGICLAPAAMFGAVGCVPYSFDVSKDQRYHGGYKLGEVYRVERDVSVLRQGANHWHTGTPLYLADPTRVTDLEKYRPGDKGIGTIARGTRVKVTKFIAYHGMPLPLYWHDLVRPIATVLDGPYADKAVDLAEISDHDYGDTMPKVDIAKPRPATLVPVDAGPGPIVPSTRGAGAGS